MEAVVTRKVSMLAEQNDLLPANHFGGWPNQSTTDALLYLVQCIKDAWRRGNMVSVLLLNISQAFPTVSHEQCRREILQIRKLMKLRIFDIETNRNQ